MTSSKPPSDGPPDQQWEARYSKKFSQERRRAERFGGAIGIVASLVCVVDAALAIQHHEMVDLGPSRGFLKIPVWIAMPLALLLLGASVWVFWGSRRVNR